MGLSGGNKRVTIIVVSSVLLVAMIVGLVFGVILPDKEERHAAAARENNPGDIKASHTSKEIVAMCETTDYKKECEKSLENDATGDKRDPQDLARAGIQVAIRKLKDVLKNSTILNEPGRDAISEEALGICKQLLNASMYDLKVSYNKVSQLNMEKVDQYAEDVRVWLSGAVNHQETCIDVCKNTTLAKEMSDTLLVPRQRISNALAMVGELTAILNSLNFKASGRRRLLDDSSSNSTKSNKTREEKLQAIEQIPAWLNGRKLDLRAATPKTLKPNVTVAQDGSGKYKTINGALKKVPKKSRNLFVIYIKEGVYKEIVTIDGMMENVVIMGDGPDKTIISGNKNSGSGIKAYNTPTFAIIGSFFVAKGVRFENTAGVEGHQAVALRVNSDFSIFYNCHIEGYQNTLYVQAYRSYFRDCTITGAIDFIFGDTVSFFQNCNILIKKPKDGEASVVAAQGRGDRNEVTGIVLHNCTITSHPENTDKNFKAYIGRPSRSFARTIVMQSEIDDVIQREGYLLTEGEQFHKTSIFREYNNTGAGADMSGRAKWPSIKTLDAKQAKAYSGGNWFEGDRWIKASGVPLDSGVTEAADHD